jgi:hypothetical protein
MYAFLTWVLYTSLGIFLVLLIYQKMRSLTFIYNSDKSNGIMVPLHNWLLFAVTSNDFVTFQRAVTSNCNGTVTRKNG